MSLFGFVIVCAAALVFLWFYLRNASFRSRVEKAWAWVLATAAVVFAAAATWWEQLPFGD